MAKSTAAQRTLLVLDVEMRGPGDPLLRSSMVKAFAAKQTEKKPDQQPMWAA
jgi:hypothetical protein